MTRLAMFGLLATLPAAALCGPAWGQTTTTNSTGSVGCAAITQAECAWRRRAESPSGVISMCACNDGSWFPHSGQR